MEASYSPLLTQAASVNDKGLKRLADGSAKDTSASHDAVPQIPTTAPDGRPLTKLEIKRAKRAARRQNQPQPLAEDVPGLPTSGGISALWREKPGVNEEKKGEKTVVNAKVSGAGNSEEAKRIREALGYSAVQAQAPETNKAVDEAQKKKMPKKKKGKKDEALEEAPVEVPAEAAPSSSTLEAPATKDKALRGPFRFGFQLVQAQVEAQTEAKIAHILMMDSTKDGSGIVPRRVYVCGMPHEWDEETLRMYWAFCGEIESMDLMHFPDSGNFNGALFITFKTEESYGAALACNGEECEGRSLKVEKCKVPPLRKKARIDAKALLPEGPPEQVEGYDVAYVGNLAYEVTRDDLIRLFKPYKSKKVRLHTDKDSGKAKGFAHVEFPDAESVKKAVEELNGHEIKGRSMKVSFAQPKPLQIMT
jgi:hypothetical protein